MRLPNARTAAVAKKERAAFELYSNMAEKVPDTNLKQGDNTTAFWATNLWFSNKNSRYTLLESFLRSGPALSG